MGGGPEAALSGTKETERGPVKLAALGRWRLEHGFAVIIVLGVAWMLWAAYDFPQSARFLPLLMGMPILALTLFQLLFQRKSVSGEIMDIGLRSLSSPEVGKSCALIAAFVGLFLLLTATAGLHYAALAFAILFPLVMSDSK